MGGKAILMITIGFGFILGYIGLNMAGMSSEAVENMSNYTAYNESHSLAVTGANVGLSKFYQDTSWFGTITQSFTGGGGNTLGNLTGSFTATMANLGGGTARLRSISNYPVPGGKTIHDSVDVYFNTGKYNGFTLYGWMSDFEGNSNFWVTGDTLWGKSHSNGMIHINGTPVFMGKATTAKTFDPKPGVGTNHAVYKGGYETGIASIPFPPNFTELVNAANPFLGGTGKTYTPPIWVSLSGKTSANKDGKAYIRFSKTGPIVDSISLNDGIFNGALVGQSDVHVQGTLDGALTIGSLGSIYVDDNALYENRNLKTTDDVLGLVSEHDVWIAKTTANNPDCVIDGSIFCRTGTMETEDITSGGVRGALTIRGSIVMKSRGEIGKYAGSVLKKGYAKKFYYDDRLANPSFRPPFYPGYWVQSYAITNWWENVRIPVYVE